MRALFDRVVLLCFEQATENVQKRSDSWCEGELGEIFRDRFPRKQAAAAKRRRLVNRVQQAGTGEELIDWIRKLDSYHPQTPAIN